MQKVLLEGAKVFDDDILLVGAFVQAANQQGFDIAWVEMVLAKAVTNNCDNLRAILLEYIEITATSAPPHDGKI